MMELTQDVWWCLFVTHLAARHVWVPDSGRVPPGLGGLRLVSFGFLVSDF